LETDATSYQSPLSTRYASEAMRRNFSDLHRFRLWRKLWIALAEAERDLGLAITPEQVAELRAHAEDVDLEAAARHERALRHDVMAHVHAWGEQCPTARGIIHLGATSCYVTDNSELIQMREGLRLLRSRLSA
jgi:adenylosuccinate lyase